MPASLFLNKAFAVSQEHLAFGDTSNLDVIPYYYRASKSHKKEDITIATLVTRNRFAVFKQLVERYRGPISVTVHVSRAELAESSSGGKGVNFLDALHALYSSSPLMSALVDVHLILTPSRNDRQFNAWRNAARLFARTDYVMMLDVDFVPCTDFRTRLLHTPKTSPIHELLRRDRAALVIPAFEYVEHKDGTDARTFPTSKVELIKLYNESRIGMFHATWSPGHNSTDYERFLYHSQPGEVYKVSPAHYQHAYEPYVIFRRDGGERTIPWCDERFVGYGGNKAACLYEMYLSGVDFYVLSDDFLVHQSHAYDEQARKLERRYNRRIYADFREEVCLKYLMAFRDEGTLGDPIARNAIEECKKVKGVARVVSMVFPLLSISR
ncbi:uncharacterized protein FOMMEDRAFT_74587 [Fomitiporia mediterranea MF3/22]|uniref:uncharacterized protein n=1 Tax=Fomitiporia mediterranea (strain MF3/22) TaxID=694068 RepID=UPI000440900B|nr:uncharacterized protein FOMMEDRAFT_74587 [Fomitiporia mediterranea MF3/22]EJD08397.1 hypothetical protein FOMMEDRAFT_74587 [Fomitiporia mediterranea MF3/22]